jgi:xanthine dehydrogenase iron-sulfur cluster and FAD-binding subunit A
VEAQLQGRVLNETTIDAGCGAIHADNIELESRGASRQYRLHLARILLKRALQQARHFAKTNLQ